MKVRDLIEGLQEMDPDDEVVLISDVTEERLAYEHIHMVVKVPPIEDAQGDDLSTLVGIIGDTVEYPTGIFNNYPDDDDEEEIPPHEIH